MCNTLKNNGRNYVNKRKFIIKNRHEKKSKILTFKEKNLKIERPIEHGYIIRMPLLNKGGVPNSTFFQADNIRKNTTK